MMDRLIMSVRLFLILIIALAALTVRGQGTSAKPASDTTQDEVFLVVEQMPSYPGGEKEMMRFIINNIEYPKEAVAKNIQGTAFVEFVVDEIGALNDIKVIRSPDEVLNPAVLAVIMKMPRWIPGRNGGKAVKVRMLIPIAFKLNSLAEGTAGNGAQNDSSIVLDKSPSFPGGAAAMLKFIQQNIEYPQEAIDKQIEGSVYIEMIVDEVGSISNIKVFKTAHEVLNPAAIAVTQKMPLWTPGMRKGKPVKVKVKIPVKFKLGNSQQPTQTR